MKRAIAGLALAVAGSAAAAEERQFYGYAYDLQSGRYLYTEVHRHQYDDGRWRSGTIGYFDVNGAPLGEKHLDFRGDPFVPRYRLELGGDDGYLEGIERDGEGITLLRRDWDEQAISLRRLEHRPPMTADSGFHNFLVAHFAELLSGQELRFRFVAAGGMDAYRFRARRIDDTTFEGQSAARFRVEPDSMLRWLVDPLVVSYDPEARRLLEYRGLSNIHDPATRKPYPAVRIAYYSKPPADAPDLSRLVVPAQAGSQ